MKRPFPSTLLKRAVLSALLSSAFAHVSHAQGEQRRWVTSVRRKVDKGY